MRRALFLAPLLAFCLPAIALAENSLFSAACESSDAIRAALESGASADERSQSGETPLHRLFRCGTVADSPAFHEATRELIDAGVDVSAVDAQGRSAVHAALESIAGHKSAVNLYVDGARLMLARSADPTLADHQGVTPLHLAAAEPAAQVTQLLLDLGVDSQTADAQGYTPLWYALTATDNLDTFALLLNQESDDALRANGLELATLAAQQQHHGKVDLLLQRLPALQLPTSTLTHALATALWQGAPLPVLERLVGAGADVASLQHSQQRDLAWRLASLGRETELNWLIAHGWQLNKLPASGYPSLYFADAQATTLLLNAGASVSLAANEKLAGTLLSPSASPPPEYGSVPPWKSRSRSEQLLTSGYKPTYDGLNRSDLALAVSAADLWLTQQLIARTPPANAAEHAKLITLALQQGRLPLVQTILRADATSPAGDTLTVRNTLAQHPTVITAYALSVDTDPILFETLLIAGADANSVDQNGAPLLHLAARQQRWSLVELLLNHGADPEQTNTQGCTLRCYEWSMPDALQQRLHQPDPLEWQAPSINEKPSAFFALAMVPALVLWLLTLGWRLATRRSLIGPTLWMITALISAVLVGSALFFQCAPCVLQTPILQLALCALIGAGGYSLCLLQAYLSAR